MNINVAAFDAAKHAGVSVVADARAALDALGRQPPAARPPLYGDGRAGERVVQALLSLRSREPVA